MSLSSVIVNLYRIREVVPTIFLPKQCHKVVSHNTKFRFFIICSKGEQKDTATTTTSSQAPSIQHKQVDKVAVLIQVDIGGHPPFPTGSKQFSGNFGNLLFLAVFNLWGHFEGLNEVFWERASQ
jgi:hypothetical protein